MVAADSERNAGEDPDYAQEEEDRAPIGSPGLRYGRTKPPRAVFFDRGRIHLGMETRRVRA